VRRVALAGCFLLVLTALGAELWASDLPMYLELNERSYVLPCLTHPTELRNETSATLKEKATFVINTPVKFGPLTTSTAQDALRCLPPCAPNADHLLGTDEIGRDVLARLIHGTRTSLIIALITVLMSLGIGLFLGSLAGYKGGIVDSLLISLMQILSTFPWVFFLLAVMSLIKIPSLTPLILVLALTRWPDVARLTRTQVMSLRERDFIRSAQIFGVPTTKILFSHLIPHSLEPALISATFAVGSTLLLESSLSFLGLGVAAPTPSWGELLSQAQRNMVGQGAWWLAVFPGLAMAGTVMTFHLLGRSFGRQFDERS
jgi:peptide/nickel transport system permease protein